MDSFLSFADEFLDAALNAIKSGNYIFDDDIYTGAFFNDYDIGEADFVDIVLHLTANDFLYENIIEGHRKSYERWCFRAKTRLRKTNAKKRKWNRTYKESIIVEIGLCKKDEGYVISVVKAARETVPRH